MSAGTAAAGLESVTTDEPVEVVGEALAAPVAERLPAGERGWVWQVSALSIVLGIMLALAVATTGRVRSAKLPANPLGITGAVLNGYREQINRLLEDNKALRNDVRRYEDDAGKVSQLTARLKEELEEARYLAGTTPVKGPGLRLILRDSPQKPIPNLTPEQVESYLVHDADIYGILNELRAAGAEAFAIHGTDARSMQRVVATTAIRCAGPTAQVNGVPLASPYTILAIGSPQALRSALEMRGGYIDMRVLKVLDMIQIEEATELVLPAYSADGSRKYSRPATTNP